MTHIAGYGKVYALGHRSIRELFDGPVHIEEKIDGSQFSFGVFGGELRCRSRGGELDLTKPQQQFALAIETVSRLGQDLHDGWTYRGEAVTTPRHNCLCYDRIPTGGVILFDIDIGDGTLLSIGKRAEEGDRLALEIVPVLCEGMFDTVESLTCLLETPSCLGGPTIEGFVVKSQTLRDPFGCLMKGKYVSEKFKEKHTGSRGPVKQSIVDTLEAAYRTEARWEKAVQHLRDRGELLGEPKDIGALVKEVQSDVEAECKDEIKDRLWVAFWRGLSKGIIRGLPEWYKDKLAEQQFAETGMDLSRLGEAGDSHE